MSVTVRVPGPVGTAPPTGTTIPGGHTPLAVTGGSALLLVLVAMALVMVVLGAVAALHYREGNP